MNSFPARTLLLAVAAALAACTATADSADDPADASVASHPLDAWQADPTTEAEVVATLQQLFDALEDGDEALLRSVVDPSVVMHFSETRDGTTTFGSASLDALATRITTAEAPLIERMWSPSVLVDGPLATLWTPYDFYAGSEFSHCGVDVASFMRHDDGWRIVALSWTRAQPPACDLHPGGPPAG